MTTFRDPHGLHDGAVPAWMRDCGTCRALLEAAEVAEADRTAYVTVASGITNHLVLAHLDLLPDFNPRCDTCQQWKTSLDSLQSPDGSGPIPQEVAEQGARQHRAAHLLPVPSQVPGWQK